MTKYHAKMILICTAAMLSIFLAQTAWAQNIEASGKVLLHQPDGTTQPISDAAVDIYRTDIKGEWHTKTAKDGRYVFVGLPLMGTYVIAVSAPGAAPSFLPNVKLNLRNVNDLTVEPGDGRRLTLDDINKAGTGAISAEEAKKRKEEYEKKVAEVAAENKKINETNVKLKDVLKAGNDALTAKKYDDAIASYDQGIQADPEQAVFYAYKSEALRLRGVDEYNKGVRAKDPAGRESAKNDFKAAVDASEKAVSVSKEVASKQAGTNAPAAAKGQADLDYLRIRAENYRLAMSTGAQIVPENAVKAMEEYVAAEPDPVKKDKAEASVGDAQFQAGQFDQAIATYRQVLAKNANNLDALWGLGLTLAADPTGAKAAEARTYIQQYLSKAPPNAMHRQDATEALQALNESLKAADNSKGKRKG